MKVIKTSYCVDNGKGKVLMVNKLLANKIAKREGKPVITCKDYRGK